MARLIWHVCGTTIWESAHRAIRVIDNGRSRLCHLGDFAESGRDLRAGGWWMAGRCHGSGIDTGRLSRRPAASAPRAVAVVLMSLLVAAFLLWGPIGPGSGPLTVYVPSGGQILGPRDRAWGLAVGMQAGNSGAVIDQVKVVGGAGYGEPRVLSVLGAEV